LLGAGRPATLVAAHGYYWVGVALGEVLAYAPGRACQLLVEAQRPKPFFLSRWNLGIKSIFQPDLKPTRSDLAEIVTSHLT
jgi:hypothetical protein